MTATTFHRVRSSHPEDDALGRTFGPGELVPNLDLEDPFNQRKLDEGIFYPVDDEDAERIVQERTGPDVTDAAARLAAEHSIDLSEVAGTGKDGRIIDADVQAVIDAIEAEDDDNDDDEEGDN
jgi:pyruvate/2-oxoglutarate dehydrogenase complex dihydrolipoamide acyltransferase (E2) component